MPFGSGAPNEYVEVNGLWTATRLEDVGVAADEADRAGAAVADSAGAAIAGLAGDPATAEVADAARAAMTYAVQVNSYTCAGLLVVGLLATLFIPTSSAAPERASGPDQAPRERGETVETAG